MNEQQTTCDEVILVLGAGIVSYMNRQRARKAFEYFEHHPNTFIISTGGKGGFLGRYMERTESDQIKHHLCDLGIEKRLIEMESEARDTEENFKKSKPLIDLINPKKVVIVTNKAHMKRAVGYAREILPEYEIIPCPTSPKWYDIMGQLYELSCLIYENTKIPIENKFFPKVHSCTEQAPNMPPW